MESKDGIAADLRDPSPSIPEFDSCAGLNVIGDFIRVCMMLSCAFSAEEFLEIELCVFPIPSGCWGEFRF